MFILSPVFNWCNCLCCKRIHKLQFWIVWNDRQQHYQHQQQQRHIKVKVSSSQSMYNKQPKPICKRQSNYAEARISKVFFFLDYVKFEWYYFIFSGGVTSHALSVCWIAFEYLPSTTTPPIAPVQKKYAWRVLQINTSCSFYKVLGWTLAAV